MSFTHCSSEPLLSSLLSLLSLCLPCPLVLIQREITSLTRYTHTHTQIVTAHCDPPSASPLLASIFPGDDGQGSSIESLAQLQGGTFKFNPTSPSRPYVWCQRLAGLAHVSPLPQKEPTSSREERQQQVLVVIQRARTLIAGHRV